MLMAVSDLRMDIHAKVIIETALLFKNLKTKYAYCWRRKLRGSVILLRASNILPCKLVPYEGAHGRGQATRLLPLSKLQFFTLKTAVNPT
mgnify:CR=1 FL=1